ncbi:hypothetical protein L2E82_39126 [Cichorium intybus]|uniref:Uncharacterized protein n=1 Tax=Cichorium intybus TaxID=13427 RepID=A0ACB9AHZ2_CICIN|nr:hypothetical protein L2E82_39126 [Cichorium intybus]
MMVENQIPLVILVNLLNPLDGHLTRDPDKLFLTNLLVDFCRHWLERETPVVLEINIPSVSRLARTAKIEFSTTSGGIRDIEFDEKKLTFYLPILNLKSDSEVILRNLVAYEELLFKNGSVTNLDFTEYVDFMCGIVDDVKDVKIPLEKKVILGDIDDEEIVKLFNGITKSSAKVEGQKSELQLAKHHSESK